LPVGAGFPGAAGTGRHRHHAGSADLFAANPLMVLFLTVGLGYFIGKARVGPIQLGGVCGTLFVALFMGQTGCQMHGELKDMAFALFIFERQRPGDQRHRGGQPEFGAAAWLHHHVSHCQRAAAGAGADHHFAGAQVHVVSWR
jgi:hypothetical protein